MPAAEWIDADTGHKVVRLTQPDGNNAGFYFHNNLRKLKPGVAVGDKRRHDKFRPELSAWLHEADIRDYPLFTLKPPAGPCLRGQRTDELPRAEIMQRWWAYMGDLMETNPDNLPVVQPLVRVFHMD